MSINDDRRTIGDAAARIMSDYTHCVSKDGETLTDIATQALAAAKILYGEAV